MKERYEIAEMEVIQFNMEDVIDASEDPFACSEETPD